MASTTGCMTLPFNAPLPSCNQKGRGSAVKPVLNHAFSPHDSLTAREPAPLRYFTFVLKSDAMGACDFPHSCEPSGCSLPAKLRQ